MIDVSVPCEKCRAPIGFRPSKCTRCGAIPSRDARAALRERLAASSADFRDLQDQISAARTVLLILALVYVGYGTLGFLAQLNALVSTADEAIAVRAALIQNVLIGAAFVICWRVARSAPLSAIIAATLLWLGLQILGAIAVSLSLFAGLWVKSVAAILLLRGIVASAKANRFLRKVRVAAQQSVAANGLVGR